MRRPPTDRSRRRSRLKTALASFFFVIVLAAVISTIAYWYFLMRSEKVVAPGQPVQVEIPAGSSTVTIARILAEKGVVGNELMFRLEARTSELDGKLRAGVYDLSTGMPYDLVLEKLSAGPPITYVTVTIPEGFVIEQIAARLQDKAGIPEEEFLALARDGALEFAEDHPYLETAYSASVEGFLFPKTYRFEEGTTARQAIETMLDQFDRELADVDVRGAKKRGLSVNELVTVASMIERETRLAKERPRVSAVIHNRLDRGMRLQICATVEYVLHKNALRLTYQDLQVDSPYNTYRIEGLPPGPISNPGLLSLKAAADPADTDYVYYVLTGKDGSHTFAATEAEFQAAKRKSKEVFGK